MKIVSRSQSYSLRNALLADRQLWCVEYDTESIRCAGFGEHHLKALGCDDQTEEVGLVFLADRALHDEAFQWFLNLGCGFFCAVRAENANRYDMSTLWGLWMFLWPENKEVLAKWITAKHDETEHDLERLEWEAKVMNTSPSR